ncbi:hypothetical protein FACS1894170_10830 [Planctomycetales bacterium]|nr:hypothetical protein FACS1894170_10830 [Planctomycetales bacterium]
MVYQCLFDRQSDEDENNFPDGWTRKAGFENGIAYPSHLTLGIAESPNPFGNYALRFNLNGGGAAVFSPKIPVKAGMSYTVSVYVLTQNLTFNEASLQLTFLGKGNAPIHTAKSAAVKRANGWQKIVIGPVVAQGETLTAGLFAIPASPTSRQDYNVNVDFADFEIQESPTVSLETSTGHHFYYSTRDIDVKCSIQGLDPNQNTVLFTLEDPFGKVISRRECELLIGNFSASKFIKIKNESATAKDDELLTATATWKNIPIRSPGFYRVRVKTPEEYVQQLKLPAGTFFEDPLDATQPLHFVIMKRAEVLPHGSFGWNLDGWNPKEIQDALPILLQSGIASLKLDSAALQSDLDYLGLLNRFHLTGIIRGLTPGRDATKSVNADAWGRALQPMLQKTSLTITDWQWSPDNDSSVADLFFAADGNVTPDGMLRFQALQQLFDPNDFGYNIGIAWDDHYELPNVSSISKITSRGIFFVFASDNRLSPDDVFEYLRPQFDAAAVQVPLLTATPLTASVKPLPEDDYSLETRIIDFVERLVLLKVAGIDTIFVEEPAGEQTGVLTGVRNKNGNGVPGVMYLPWRTTATLLADSPFIGSITLPNRSRNYCFGQSDGTCLMIVWNHKATSEKPTLEKLYLGNDVLITDVWGKQVLSEINDFKHEILVSSMPIFVSGLDGSAVRLRQGFKTNVKSIPATPNQKNRITFTINNPLQRILSLQITPVPPRNGDWTIDPPVQTINIEPNTTAEGAFDLTLSPRADTGLQMFRYNIALDDRTSGTPMFEIFDHLQIGNPDISMEFTCRLNEKDELEVIQTFINNTDKKLTYDCRLSVTEQPVQKNRIIRQDFGSVEHVYTVKRGKELIDKGVKEMSLRAVPINDGTGIQGEPLIYTIPITEE